MMATKRFVSTTGYGVTVFATDAHGNSRELRVGAEDDPFETDDKDVIQALSGTGMVSEVKDKRVDTSKAETPEPEPSDPDPKPEPEPAPEPEPEVKAPPKARNKGGR